VSERKEDWALRAIMRAMYVVGISATNADEAYQAIDLAAKLLSAALDRKISADEVRDRMADLIDEYEAQGKTRH
jgi:2-hydroxychromene-2-carboxylate isomerase